MRFTHFKLWKVVVPARREILEAPESAGAYSHNLSWGDLPIYVIEGYTDTGIVALGEGGRGEPLESIEPTLRDLLGRDLSSFHPATLDGSDRHSSGLPARQRQWAWQTNVVRSRFVIETLWTDAMGKALNVPAHFFYGGGIRDRVAADFWANRPSAPVLQKLVAESIKHGCQGMKVKCDAWGDTVNSICEIADDVPANYRFTIDAMCEWRTWRESRHLWKRLEKLPFRVQIEDPFAQDAFSEWHLARQHSDLTIIFHGRDEAVLISSLKEGLADAYNVGGGLGMEFVRLALMADGYGFDCWHGSGLELGALQHMHLHAAASARNCVLASDLQSEWVREHTLITPRMEYRDGYALVPKGPGLGIAWDHAAIAKYCQGEATVE